MNPLIESYDTAMYAKHIHVTTNDRNVQAMPDGTYLAGDLKDQPIFGSKTGDLRPLRHITPQQTEIKRLMIECKEGIECQFTHPTDHARVSFSDKGTTITHTDIQPAVRDAIFVKRDSVFITFKKTVWSLVKAIRKLNPDNQI